MLIYNHTKEFVGINEEGLRVLGCANLNELLNECYDFADLFVKRPGFIHNFKNFNWIDFIMHAEADEAKAIVHIKGKSFSCQIEVKDFSLVADPSNSAYEVILTHIKAVSSDESAKIAQEVSSTPRPEQRENVSVPAPMMEPDTFTEDVFKTEEVVEDSLIPPFDDTEEEEEEVSFPPIEDSIEDSNAEYDPYDVPSSTDETDDNIEFDPTSLVPDFDKPLEIEDDVFLDNDDENPLESLNEDGKLDINFDDEDDFVSEDTEEAPMLGDYISHKDAEYIDNLKTDKNYQYDPHVAADELGLPVDLIEEFIEDFIQQAHEFNDELYESTAKEDYDNVKVLSHKLKGVAANLRIEDAFEVLSIVNTSDDREEIEANLKQLNRIIAKLEGKDPDEVMGTASTSQKELLEPTPEEIKEPSIEAPLASLEEDLEDDDIDLPPMPELEDDSEDDLYAFNVKEEETPTPSIDSTEDEDLYDFAPIDSIEENLKEDEADNSDEDDLYAMDPMEKEDTDDLLPPMPETPLEDDDLYALEPLENKEDEKEEEDDLLSPMPETSMDDEDLYALDPLEDEGDLLPPMPETSTEDDLYSMDTIEQEKQEEDTPVVKEIISINFDSSKAANELGIDSTLVHELVEDFIIQAKDLKHDLEMQIEDQNFTSIARNAIILKGVSDNLRISEVSEQLTLLSNTQDTSVAKDAITKLYLYIDQL